MVGSRSLTVTRLRTGFHAASIAEELSAAQRAAVTSEARLVVVQGGPGAGKTAAAVARVVRLTTHLRQDPAWLLALVTSETKARAFRLRLASALAAAGCPESAVERTTACVVPATGLLAPPPGDSEGRAAWPPGGADRVASAADRLAPAIGLARHPGEAADLLVETMRLLARGGEPREAAAGEGDWLRRGVALVEETVRFAQVEALRRLRMLDGAAAWLGDLGRELRRPADVSQRARALRSALDRAVRSGAPDAAELERVRGWVDIAAIDLVEAARREAIAALARRRLWDTARALLLELGTPCGAGGPGGAGGLGGSLFAGARHVIVDDAHDLPNGVVERLRRGPSRASLFVTGDQRAAAWRDGSLTRFRSLLREAGRAVVLLEAPRFGAGVGRFVNALGSRLWPSSEPGGYAPAIARLDADPSAAPPVELWLVRRRAVARAGGGDHPEPIADARLREARAVVALVRRVRGGARSGDVAVLAQDERVRSLLASVLEAEGAGSVDLRTVEECRGLEWSTVVVTGLDEPLGGPAPRRAWLDEETGLAVVWPEDDNGRRVWPFSSLLLAQRAAAMRDAAARQRLFLAAARARTRLVLTGVTRDRAAGGETCVAPIEWLRRQLGIMDLVAAGSRRRMGEAAVGIRVVDSEPFLPA